MGGIAGAWISFQLILKDIYGNIATNAAPNLSIDVVVTGPSANITSNHTVVQQGIVTVGYSTTVAGNYTIEIKVEGKIITGSPFTVEISDGAIDASFCSASGVGVSAYGSVSNDNNFTITIRDQYQNVIVDQPLNLSIYVSIIGPKSNFSSPPINWDNVLKKYVVEYRTAIAGFYLINITINGDPISGNPYSSRILPETVASPNLTVVSGTQPNEVAGVQSYFIVSTFDQYNNRLETNSSDVFVQVISSFENIQTIIEYVGHGSYAVYWTSKYENWGVFVTVFVDEERVYQDTTSIVPSQIDPKKCTLDGLGYSSAIKGDLSIISLNARDSFDNIVKGYHSFSVTIRNTVSPTVVISNTIESNGNGTFFIHYIPKVAGTYIIDIQYRGNDIRGSPSFLIVTEGVNWGSVVGITIGSIAFISIIFGITYFYWLKHKTKKQFQVLDEEDQTNYDD